MSKKRKRSPFNLTITLSFGVFFGLLLAMAVGVIIIVILFRTGLLDDFSEGNLISAIALLVIISMVIGTTFATLFGNSILNPFRVLNYAMKNLSRGNFKTRIDLTGRFTPYEFEELTNSFNLMAEQLGSLEIMRNDFINDFSHEFKTPIVSIKGFAKILSNKDLTEEEREEYINIIISEADRLTTLSKNVLLLSKIENQTTLVDQENYNLTEQIRSSIILLQKKWTDKQQELDIDLEEDVYFYGNEELLSMVWINLLDNAIKFTNEKGIIAISLKKQENSIKIIVKDSGPGMSEETKKRIFDKFYQGDSSHSTEGNGIGLTLVSRVVKLHDGLLTVESSLHKGSSFIVTLPYTSIETEDRSQI